MAGAAWAEFWVEDHVALRIGPELGRDRWLVALLSDLAWFDERLEAAFAAAVRHAQRGRWVEAATGWAP